MHNGIDAERSFESRIYCLGQLQYVAFRWADCSSNLSLSERKGN
jgi:hypothetical protein